MAAKEDLATYVSSLSEAEIAARSAQLKERRQWLKISRQQREKTKTKQVIFWWSTHVIILQMHLNYRYIEVERNGQAATASVALLQVHVNSNLQGKVSDGENLVLTYY